MLQEYLESDREKVRQFLLSTPEDQDGSAAGPRFVEKPSTQEVLEGEDVIFRCRATGSPRPEVQWTKDDAFINFDERINPRFQLRSGDLHIRPVNKGDTGVYGCSATT